MIRKDSLFINGQWEPSQQDSIDVVNPFTEKVMATIPAGTKSQVDKAVKAAKRSFDIWSSETMDNRVQLLKNVQKGLVARQDEIAQLITDEVGMPIKMAKRIQAFLPPAVLDSFCQLASQYVFETQLENSIIRKVPVGVVACITPWNYPLHQVVAKVAPALLSGCTVVLKPSEVAPLTAFLLAEVIDEVGLPDGVFNLVTGYGNDVGEALVGHSDIDMVSFTGSVDAGKRVATIAAQDIKRVTLELGGKSASIILDDADVAKAVKSTVNACFLNSGQTCNALTRLLVPEQLYDEVVAQAVTLCEAFTLGDPHDPETKLGPLVSDQQRSRVRHFIETGLTEGAELICGGSQQPKNQGQGYFVEPTILGRVTPDMTVAQSEIFGPVLCIMTYQNDDDAIHIANNSRYGLGGAVWSADVSRARNVASQLRTGQVDVNGGAFNLLAPFGGFKESGYGRELGECGFEEYLEVMSIQL
jgi:betaine-aldehyde dehydrogenase